MNPTLQAFLHAQDLDELLALSGQLNDLNEQDHETITSVLYHWQDLQAVANIMMYPRLMPRAQVLRHLIRAFEDDNQYLSLAATVGLQTLEHNFFTDWHRAQLVDILIDKLNASALDVARRASVTLGEFIKDEEISKLTPFLNHYDDVVRHNVVIAHRIARGVEATRDLLKHVLDTYPLSVESRSFLEQRYAEAIKVANDPSSDGLWLSNLSGPLLSYIPNFCDWSSAAT
jgi:HEAT repeat protein